VAEGYSQQGKAISSCCCRSVDDDQKNKVVLCGNLTRTKFIHLLNFCIETKTEPDFDPVLDVPFVEGNHRWVEKFFASTVGVSDRSASHTMFSFFCHTRAKPNSSFIGPWLILPLEEARNYDRFNCVLY
jgi:hypothetical protein